MAFKLLNWATERVKDPQNSPEEFPRDEDLSIDICTEYSPRLGPRWRKDGPYSGEEFYEKLLLPRFLEARAKGALLWVDLDGVWGYSASFIITSFGRLSKEYGADEVLRTIRFKSVNNEIRKEHFIRLIREPKPL